MKAFSTGADSKANLVLNDNSNVTVGPGSTLKLDDFVYSGAKAAWDGLFQHNERHASVHYRRRQQTGVHDLDANRSHWRTRRKFKAQSDAYRNSDYQRRGDGHRLPS